MVPLPDYPRSKRKDVGETGTLMAQTIRGQGTHMHSNRPGTEGEHRCQLGVLSKIRKESSPERQGTVSLSLLR